MKIKSLIILIIGAALIGVSSMAASADEITRTNDVPVDVTTLEEQSSDEPILIAPNPNEEPLVDQSDDSQEIIPLLDRGKPVPSTSVDDGSEMSLISPAGSKNSGESHFDTPVFFILGIVGFLVVLLLVINRRK